MKTKDKLSKSINKKPRRWRLLSLVLSLCLILAMVPGMTISASAITPAARNMTTFEIFATLQEAVDAVADGETIKLNVNLTESVSISSGTAISFTLDLNGKELQGSGEDTIKHEGSGALTIDDSGSCGKITNDSTYNTITLYGSSELIVNGGRVENTNTSGSERNAIQIQVFATAKVTIDGGAVENTGTGYAINNEGSGDICITAGIVKANSGIAIKNYEGSKITISGTAEVTSDSGYYTMSINSYSTPEPTLEITGGTISNTNANGKAISFTDPVKGTFSIPSGSAIIIMGKGGASNKAPDLSAYTNVKISASKTATDGSSTTVISKGDIDTNTKTQAYKYLKFELAVAPPSPPSGGGGSRSDSGIPVTVDGKTENIGKESKSGDSTTVTVDREQLSENIADAKLGSSVVVTVGENSKATASLVVKNVKEMAEKDMTLTVKMGKIAYILEPAAIDMSLFEEAFPGVDLGKIPFEVSISKSSARVEGEHLILSPVEFTVTASYNGRTVSVDTFNSYVDREIEVTKAQAEKITTAVVVNPDGSLRHVPTKIVERGGKYYVVVSSRSNSVYAFIQNEKSFADAAGKWYEQTVKEMAGRKIISGRTSSAFDGDASISRAEFAAILVRGLGLPLAGTSSFTDVSASSWYGSSVATAADYGLVEGKGANLFDPNAKISRQEAMLILQKSATLIDFKGASSSLDMFADGSKVSSWAKDAAAWNVGSGLIQGSNGNLNPIKNISRAESAAIILRLLQKAELIDPAK